MNGTQGYEGITLHMDLNGDLQIDTSITFTGLTSGDVDNQQPMFVGEIGYLLITS